MTIHESNRDSAQGFMDQMFDRIPELIGLGGSHGTKCRDCGGCSESVAEEQGGVAE